MPWSRSEVDDSEVNNIIPAPRVTWKAALSLKSMENNMRRNYNCFGDQGGDALLKVFVRKKKKRRRFRGRRRYLYSAEQSASDRSYGTPDSETMPKTLR